jgi:hypothetical protein
MTLPITELHGQRVFAALVRFLSMGRVANWQTPLWLISIVIAPFHPAEVLQAALNPNRFYYAHRERTLALVIAIGARWFVSNVGAVTVAVFCSAAFQQSLPLQLVVAISSWLAALAAIDIVSHTVGNIILELINLLPRPKKANVIPIVDLGLEKVNAAVNFESAYRTALELSRRSADNDYILDYLESHRDAQITTVWGAASDRENYHERASGSLNTSKLILVSASQGGGFKELIDAEIGRRPGDVIVCLVPDAVTLRRLKGDVRFANVDFILDGEFDSQQMDEIASRVSRAKLIASRRAHMTREEILWLQSVEARGSLRMNCYLALEDEKNQAVEVSLKDLIQMWEYRDRLIATQA